MVWRAGTLGTAGGSRDGCGLAMGLGGQLGTLRGSSRPPTAPSPLAASHFQKNEGSEHNPGGQGLGAAPGATTEGSLLPKPWGQFQFWGAGWARTPRSPGARWPRFPPPAPHPPGNFEREITVPRIRPWRWPQGAAASSCWGHPSALTAGKGRECHRPVGHRGSPPARGGRGSCSPSAKRCLISANEEERSWSYTMAAAGNSGAFTLCAR